MFFIVTSPIESIAPTFTAFASSIKYRGRDGTDILIFAVKEIINKVKINSGKTIIKNITAKRKDCES